MMEKRINIHAIAPQAYDAVLALEKYLAKSEISRTLKELIKIRASQINGCAFCIDMHTKDALKNGETNQRIFLLDAWREVSGFFTEEERITLAMTEEITHISKNGLSDETYQKAITVFGENKVAEIIMTVVTINAWNRIAVSTRMEVAG
ncbi:alkyl hydroperoxide reductase AhpD [Parapedobacter defluvii]|uniref:Alkyl hydroperoxide reductase AhpD n=2 Tax=Parapedobacter defluvii TaxID=2045106 RepID=A0ABQ1MFG4_9SPHI|nr:alkyl hydroperoxide reductase AhpD [Parapedobacter defluvii]